MRLIINGAWSEVDPTDAAGLRWATAERDARQLAVVRKVKGSKKRGRGRPPGSKNKTTLAREAMQRAGWLVWIRGRWVLSDAGCIALSVVRRADLRRIKHSVLSERTG